MNPRETYQEFEDRFLSSYAVRSTQTRGRARPEEECDIRTPFQRDRDRIIHCKSFRRLKHKTQVFLAPEGDHYRTRLTHTLEVSQISRTIACALRLNEPLTEAAALGHDLGHTPFGHAGERALASICPEGFNHAAQSLRVVDVLERDRHGLNLTWEVRDAIVNHTSGPCRAATLEGQAVKLADVIAYVNHDIDDAVRAGILTNDDLPFDAVYVLGRTGSARISTAIHDIVKMSENAGVLMMSDEVESASRRLHDFMWENVYTNPVAKNEERKVEGLLEKLYTYFKESPRRLPAEYYDYIDADGVDRVVCDYIAGMTDRYVIELYNELFIPRTWKR